MIQKACTFSDAKRKQMGGEGLEEIKTKNKFCSMHHYNIREDE